MAKLKISGSWLSNLAAPGDGPAQSDFVGIFEVAADWQT
jgi:hypothetical protein